jgi:hypothetical protein
VSDKPNCYECIHRRKVPGDAHSQCCHPHTANLKVVGNPVGIQNGWFMWPFNFDPTWLRECNGFESVNSAIIEGGDAQ